MNIELGNLTKVTPEVTQALGANFAIYLEEEAQKVPTWHLPFFDDIPSSDLAIGVQVLTSVLKLLPWVDDRKAQNLAERLKLVMLETKEASVGIDRNDILYASQRKQLTRRLAAIPRVVPRWQIDQLKDYLVNGHGSGAEYKGIDGVPLFATTHPVAKKGVVSGNVQQNYWSDLDLTVSNVYTVMQAMKVFVGDNGEPMEIDPTHLWYSPNLAETVDTILKKEIVSSASNPMFNRFTPLEIKGLTTDNLWGLFDANAMLKPFAYVHAIETQPRWLVEPGEEKRQGLYGFDIDCATSVLAWWAITKCVHTP